MEENFLYYKLKERSAVHALRSLRPGGYSTDFYSNDYLGIVKHGLIEELLQGSQFPHGSTGSRLLSGNYKLIEETENEIALFHNAPAALIFNSGYDANFGLLACIAHRGDLILYDKLSHASIRDGIRQSFADSFSFAHNDLSELEKKLQNRTANEGKSCFVVTESVFSMDGDMAPLAEIADLCDRYGANLIVDEAHATGVIGEKGEGAVQHLGIQDRCFARLHTFGKALGCHGAVILGSQLLRDFLINFCRPFIYSTAIPPSSVAAIRAAYKIFPSKEYDRAQLKKLISLFDHKDFKKSNTPIQCFILPGNENVKKAAVQLLENNLDVRPILYPTVPLGEERLRIALHSFNTEEETKLLIEILSISMTDDR
ncbi:MAG TPA: 8-amino-7-oxononanoate synthase [Puia sp.]|nr:8-amino-7-oxononanoate synthase [Puia sp.]